jgi:hypothetical protein
MIFNAIFLSHFIIIHQGTPYPCNFGELNLEVETSERVDPGADPHYFGHAESESDFTFTV